MKVVPKDKADKQSDKADKDPTFGELFNFNTMFRVKGKEGLVSLVSHKQGAKIAVVCGIYNHSSKRSERTKNLICLGGLEFIKKDKSTLKMSDVFTNLSSYTVNSDDYGFEQITVEELMPIMVPDFDDKKFTVKHANQVLGWYIEVIIKYSAVVEQQEIQENTSKNK